MSALGQSLPTHRAHSASRCRLLLQDRTWNCFAAKRRRIATRYDKLAANYLAFIKLASIRIWLHAYEVRALAGRTDFKLAAADRSLNRENWIAVLAVSVFSFLY